MRSALVIIAEICLEDTPQMPLVQNDHVIKYLPADAPDEAFDGRILPKPLRWANVKAACQPGPQAGQPGPQETIRRSRGRWTVCLYTES
jgi:hypothetical protein